MDRPGTLAAVPMPMDVLRSFTRTDPTRPRITWYQSPTGERVELSGKTLDNWLSKAANLMLEEFDIGRGSRVLLDLPPTHWRAAYWATAVWALGAHLTICRAGNLPGDTAATGQDPDLVVTDNPQRFEAGAPLVAVTLAALARSYPSALPGGVLDEARQLAGYGDVFLPDDEPDPGDHALTEGTTSIDYASLVPSAGTPGRRIWLPSDTDGIPAVRTMLGAWAEGGAVVVLPTEPRDAVARVLRSEGVTLPGGA